MPRTSGADLTFITNEGGQSLLERFNVLVRDTRFFDVLVGYFYTSGFYALYPALENSERIRVLIGIATSRETVDLVNSARQQQLQFSHAEAKETFSGQVAEEMEPPGDDDRVEEGVRKFREWLRSGKLEIRAYPSANLHAKLYIMTFAEGDRDAGRVITGSSNFTRAGLVDNLEFNVELKTRADYEFALRKFNDLWAEAVDVKDTYIDTIERKTWLNDSTTPYELYLKFLYEYFRDELSQSEELFEEFLPEEFMRLEYQEQAVHNARRILDEYGGVFLADVVGLGKTYMAAMLAAQLHGRTLVIAPPVLLDRDNPGSWPSVFSDFKIHADFESVGKLDRIIERGSERYENVIVDEAHRFRTEDTIAYEQLSRICRGKRVILVTATPYNNRPRDILALVKLFQRGRLSTLPNLTDLEHFFGNLERRLYRHNRQSEYAEYIRISRDNSRQIRERVLRYLTVRRTRSDIARYFSADLEHRGLRFPEVMDPQPIYYQLNVQEDQVFAETIGLLVRGLKYARYAPLTYYTGSELTPTEAQIQKLSEDNLRIIMRILLVKRLESSFHAFRLSLDRFIRSYELFLRELGKGNVYTSKENINKVFQLLDQDNDEAIQRLIDEGKAEKYPASDFGPDLKRHLDADLAILNDLKSLWAGIKRDPKWLAFSDRLKSDPVLGKGKLIVFTESKETAEYLTGQLQEQFPNQVLTYSGGSSAETRQRAIQNFDARARHPKDDYQVLVSTEVLSEGVNLHRSNVVINYDIPWNPTRMMQRVGRINRVDTKHEQIYTYTFFPTTQSNDQLRLKEAAEAKIHAFIALLGADARLLTDGEPIESHELFNRLFSKETVTGEKADEKSELKYLNQIRAIQKGNPDLFARIKAIPKKARTARREPALAPALITFFRRGKLRKFFRVAAHLGPDELDFLAAAEILEVAPDTPRAQLGPDYHDCLKKNRSAFERVTTEEALEPTRRGSRDPGTQLLHILRTNEIRTYQGFTEENDAWLKRLVQELEAGGIPKRTAREALRAVQKELKKRVNPPRVLAVFRHHIPDQLLQESGAHDSAHSPSPREVILSEYLTNEGP